MERNVDGTGGTEVFQYPGGSTIKFSIRQLPLKMPNSQQFMVQDISTSYMMLHVIFRHFDLRCLPSVPC